MYARLCPCKYKKALGYRQSSPWDGSSCGSTSHKLRVADTSTTADNQTATSEGNVCCSRGPSDNDALEKDGSNVPNPTKRRRFEDCR